MKMFESARLKLTVWYLLIIMLVSLAFSAVIYRMTSGEIERFARSPRFMIENPGPDDDQLVADAEQRLLFLLLELNGIILVSSGSLAYFLAGRTLKPIKQMLEEQNQFISDASHELRTPLTSLKSAMEVNLRDKNLSMAEARKLIKENIEDVDQLQSLSDHLLQLTSYHKPDNEIKLEKVALAEIVTKAVAKVELIAKKKKITIDSSGVEDVELKANKYNLNDLLIILLDNAIKYSPGKKAIRVGARRTDGWALLSVEDEGMGISEKDMPHIFERFYRADSARSKEGAGGYGLGLSIAKKIVESHRGSISVKSKIGKGTAFTVKLPVFS